MFSISKHEVARWIERRREFDCKPYRIKARWKTFPDGARAYTVQAWLTRLVYTEETGWVSAMNINFLRPTCMAAYLTAVKTLSHREFMELASNGPGGLVAYRIAHAAGVRP